MQGFRAISSAQKAFILLGLLLHLAVCWQALSQRTYLTDDSVQYLQIADNWSEYGVFSQSYDPPLAPDLQRVPGYPLFLRLTGQSPELILILQQILALLNAFLLYLILVRMIDRSLAIWAGIGLLLMPYQWVFASLILSETLFITLLLAGTWFLFRFWEKASWQSWLIFSLLWVGASYVRPVSLPLLVLAQLFFLVYARKQWLKLMPGLLLTLALLLPWILRNQQVSGQLTFNSMGAMGMLHGRLGGLEAHRQGRSFDEIELYRGGDSLLALKVGLPRIRSYYHELQNHETGLYPKEVGSLTVSYFLQHPLQAVIFQGRCLAQMLGGLAYGWSDKVLQNKGLAKMAAGLQLLFNLLMYGSLFLSLWVIRYWDLRQWLLFGGVVLILLISAAAWADGRYRMVIDPWLWGLSFLFWAPKAKPSD